MKNSELMRLGLTGDVMIGRLVNEMLAIVPPEYIWGNTLALFHATDFNFINLEAALTTSTQIVEKVFNFKSDPKNVEALKLASINAVNLANNHVLDFDVEGLIETLETLDLHGIGHVGAGKNSDEAKKAYIAEVDGIKIAFLGYTDNEPSWQAEKEASGTNYIEVGNKKRVQSDIERIKDLVDLVIVTIHWGPNMNVRPFPEFVQFAHSLIDMGVDLIHGHSAHIFQGVEVYKNKLILYDTGDFVDDYMVDPILRNDRSFFFEVGLEKDGPRFLKMKPVLISNCQANLAQGKEKKAILRHMKLLSFELGTEFMETEDELYLNIDA